MTAASIDVHAEGGSVRIAISGEIDLDNASYVGKDIFAAINNEVRVASVDLTNVTFMDSAGIQILFRLAERLETLQAALELVVPPDSPTRLVIEHSGLGSVALLRPETKDKPPDTQEADRC